MLSFVFSFTPPFTCSGVVSAVALVSVSAGVVALSSPLFSPGLFSDGCGEVLKSFEFVKAISAAFLISLLISFGFDSFSLLTLSGVV